MPPDEWFERAAKIVNQKLASDGPFDFCVLNVYTSVFGPIRMLEVRILNNQPTTATAVRNHFMEAFHAKRCVNAP